MKIIDADNFKTVLETVISDPKIIETISYYLDEQEEIDIIENYDVIPREWILKWGRKANRNGHIALMFMDWDNERKKMGYIEL